MYENPVSALEVLAETAVVVSGEESFIIIELYNQEI